LEVTMKMADSRKESLNRMTTLRHMIGGTETKGG